MFGCGVRENLRVTCGNLTATLAFESAQHYRGPRGGAMFPDFVVEKCHDLVR